jgi:hypothetical protein
MPARICIIVTQPAFIHFQPTTKDGQRMMEEERRATMVTLSALADVRGWLFSLCRYVEK